MTRAPDRTGVQHPWDEVDELAGLLFQTQQRFRTHFEDACAAVDVPPAQASLLRHLDEPRLMHELADAMGCDAGNVTGLVDRLEDRSLVERVPDPADRRRRVVTLTAAGRDRRDRLRDALFTDPPGVQGLSADDRVQLRRLLHRLLDDDQTPSPD